MKELLLGFANNYMANYFSKIILLYSLRKKKKKEFNVPSESSWSLLHMFSRILSIFSVLTVPTKHQTLPQTQSKTSCRQFQCSLHSKIHISICFFQHDALRKRGEHCRPVRDGMDFACRAGLCSQMEMLCKVVGFLVSFTSCNVN